MQRRFFVLDKLHLLATIAEKEAQYAPFHESVASERSLQMDRLLSVVTPHFASTTVQKPLSWDCLFAYFCCIEAGFLLPKASSGQHPTLLHSASAWKAWASSVEQLTWQSYAPEIFVPQRGDLIILNAPATEAWDQRIGIVHSFTPGNFFIGTVEGTEHKSVEFFLRRYNESIQGFIRLTS